MFEPLGLELGFAKGLGLDLWRILGLNPKDGMVSSPMGVCESHGLGLGLGVDLMRELG